MVQEATVNATRSDADTARAYAEELCRLGSALGEMGYSMREGPLEGAEVDTALEVIRDLRECYEAWKTRAEALDRIVTPIVRVMRQEGYVRP